MKMPTIIIKVSGKSKEVKKAIFGLLCLIIEKKLKVKVTTDSKQYKKMYGN